MSSEPAVNHPSESRASVHPLVVKLPPARTVDTSISGLVGEVYESAPPIERGRLLEQLLRPLAILSLFGIAGGIFARPRMRGGWHELHIKLEDIQGIRAGDVVVLVDHAQQVSVEAVEELAQLLPTLPAASRSAATGPLIAALARHARRRHGDHLAGDDEAAAPR
jgi:hypothetical protein